MRERRTILVSILLFVLCSFALLSFAAPSLSNEYRLKAGFCYRFLLFSNWPESSFAEEPNTIIIGILGANKFGDAFDAVEGTPVNNRKLRIVHFEGTASIDSLKSCHLLFISSSLQKRQAELLKALKDHPILTVGETTDFIEQGGMINLILKKNNIVFEISRPLAKRVNITFSSKLLRLAARIIEEGDDGK